MEHRTVASNVEPWLVFTEGSVQAAVMYISFVYWHEAAIVPKETDRPPLSQPVGFSMGSQDISKGISSRKGAGDTCGRRTNHWTLGMAVARGRGL